MKLKQKKNKKISWDKKLTTSCQVLWYHCEITVNSEIVTLLDEGIFNNGGLTLALNLLIHTKYLKWKNEWPENKKNYFFSENMMESLNEISSVVVNVVHAVHVLWRNYWCFFSIHDISFKRHTWQQANCWPSVKCDISS